MHTGHGFHIKIDDEVFLFPTAERAPPEAYLSRGYEAYVLLYLPLHYLTFTRWTHTDKAYCKYAFSFCVGRELPEQPPQQNLPCGSSFVDIGLKVAVRQDRGTVTAFRPEYLHGTTLAYGAINSIIAITFSKRVGDAWKEARHGSISVDAQAGVLGNGDTAGVAASAD